MGQSLIGGFTGHILRGAENQLVSRIPAINSRVFSVILLPTSECNVACDYCFEHKEPHRLSSVLVPLLTRRLLDIREIEIVRAVGLTCGKYFSG
jgi:MoaA/NifB/PqqE/SkfB family radical SAM enzyme